MGSEGAAASSRRWAPRWRPSCRAAEDGGQRAEGGGKRQKGKTAKRRNRKRGRLRKNARRGRRGRRNGKKVKQQKEETGRNARLRVGYGLGRNQSFNPLGRKMGAERLSVTGLWDFSDPIFLTSLPWSGIGANLQSVAAKRLKGRIRRCGNLRGGYSRWGRRAGGAIQIKVRSVGATAEEGAVRLWAPLKRQVPSDSCAVLRLNCLGWGGSPTAEVLPQRAQRAQRMARSFCGFCVFSAVKKLGWLGTQTHGLHRRGELFHALPRLDFRF